MKINPLIIIIFIFVACKSSTLSYHNGTYIYNATNETIIIDGNRATLQLRSLLNKSKVKKTDLICTQYPDRIELLLRNQPPIIITVEKGNFIWDGNLFKKQITLHRQ